MRTSPARAARASAKARSSSTTFTGRRRSWRPAFDRERDRARAEVREDCVELDRLARLDARRQDELVGATGELIRVEHATRGLAAVLPLVRDGQRHRQATGGGCGG